MLSNVCTNVHSCVNEFHPLSAILEVDVFCKTFPSDVCLHSPPNVCGILLWVNLYGNLFSEYFHASVFLMSLINVFVQTLAVTVERYIAVCRPHQHLGLVTVIGSIIITTTIVTLTVDNILLCLLRYDKNDML